MLLRPSAAEPHRFAARCLAGSGQHPQARIEYRLAISFGSANAFSEASRHYSALPDLLQVVPVTPSGLLMLGRYLLVSRPGDAAVVFERLWNEFSEGQALAPWARALLDLDEPERALELARRRTVQSPGDVAAWRVAADSLSSLGKPDEAAEEARRGLAACPGARSLVEFLVERSLELRRYAEADDLAAGVSARTPEEFAAKSLLRARVLASQHRYVAALDQARDAVKAMPGALGPLLELSGYAELAGQYDEAIAQLRAAASLPGQDEARYKARFDRLEVKARALANDLSKRRVLGAPTQ
jgi:tetratricopeptide (TPR) repeat protein